MRCSFLKPFNFQSNKQQRSLTFLLMRYRLYQYVIAINHFKDELFICENQVKGLESEVEAS